MMGAVISTSPAVKERDPLHVLAVLARRKGDIFVYTTGQPQSFLVNRPEWVRHVLVDGADRYSKDTPINSGFADTIAHGLLNSEGAVWRRQRSLMQPAFARRYLPTIASVVDREVERMVDAWPHSNGHVDIDLHAETTKLLFRITSIALFSVDPRPWDGRLTMPILTDALPVLTDESQYPFRVAQQAIWSVAENIVAQRLVARRAFDDLLGRLIHSGTDDADFDALRDHVVNMALSGYETTASVVTWAMYTLAQNPAIVATLRGQIDSVTGGQRLTLGHLASLPYLTATVKETMRLYPPAWIIGRRALHTDVIGGVEIPVNSVVAISPYTMHRHPRYWPEPDNFEPARFLGDDTDREKQPFTYIPFGAGPRTCIGTNFAQVEAPLIIGQLLQRFSFEVMNDAAVEPRGIFVLVPSDRIHVRLRSRAA